MSKGFEKEIQIIKQKIEESFDDFVEKSLLSEFIGGYQAYEIKEVFIDGSFDAGIKTNGVWVDFDDCLVFDFEDDEIAIWWDTIYIKGEKARKLFVFKIIEKLAEKVSILETRGENE